MGPMLCTVKVGEKKVSCGGVIDLAVEQPQLFRKLHKNQNKTKQYTIEVWGLGTYANITNTMLILQNSAWRAIHNLPFITHLTEYFKNANI